MQPFMTGRAKCNQVQVVIGALLTASSFVVDLQILLGTADSDIANYPASSPVGKVACTARELTASAAAWAAVYSSRFVSLLRE